MKPAIWNKRSVAGGGGARGLAGCGDQRSAPAGGNSAARLPGAAGVAVAGPGAPGSRAAIAHVQPTTAQENFVLHMQHEIVPRNRVAVGDGLETVNRGSRRVATLGPRSQPRAG